MKNDHATQPETALDPVCGMTIELADVAGQSTLGGTTYHFCSPACKRKFDANPTTFGAKRAGCCA